MDTHDFITHYGGVYEHSPWVAERVAPLAAEIDDAEQLAALMAECVDNAAVEQQLELIRAHPDLAGKAQLAGELTEDSTQEQASAGLDQCSSEEFERFQSLNTAYWDKFGLPKITPKYDLGLDTWWVDPRMEAALVKRKASLKKK